mmetsp:Transcript_48090/g.71271  ORF Transcript_48090/g.71271 Transcript_48090/m.71271 type:complete len:243 (+) Transcript_48090:39-767(+)|eukprot:CAMPEP_0195523136 /NCGR_PEP_ID=MMETSP0794_2-20130614/22007_1 /TAXON_ID=515487 /ORGANISM="Stephanopyxis turris, Strain CCMP 815" /LENGTH=242 /DNA_ID=CAMNT_0040653055 /DNA_START=21 /DNA_END=749 /DNA_ORIENTATION=+
MLFAPLRATTLLATKLSAAAMSTSAQSCKTGPAALIFLHGLGDSPAGWSSLEYSLPSIRPRLKDIKYVFPPAPTISITINGGATMPGWFDLYDWPIGVGAKDDREGKLAAVSQIEKEVSKLEAEGIPKSRIVVGGFSQGGAIALLAAYRSVEPYAGCGALSAWLTLTDELSVPEAAKVTPLFWAHGQYDDKVLFEQQAFGVEKLETQGISITKSDYPMGHESHPKEIEAFATFVDDLLFGEE